MGRHRKWTDPAWEEWQGLLESKPFAALMTVVDKGLRNVTTGELAPLRLETSPRVEVAREQIRNAARTLKPAKRAAAVGALLRATPESEELSSPAQAQRLARVHLGEADPYVRDGETDPLKKVAALPTVDNSAFRRRPSQKREGGEMFKLLRELLEELVPEPVTAEGEEEETPPHISAEVAEAARRAETGSASQLEPIARLIGERYRTDLELTQFASLVVEDHEVVERMDMSVELKDGDDETYVFHVLREFQARFDRYVVCVAAGNPTHAVVMRVLPELRELIWLPAETANLDTAVRQLIDDGMLQLRNERSADGYESAKFEPVPDTDPMRERLDLQGVDRQKYRLISYEVGADSELRHYRSVLPMRLQRGRPHCAWFADGPTYINTIRIDLSRFQDAAESHNARVHYFLPGRDSPIEPPRFERIVHSWVVRRHGFVISW